jgi:hypothetical protein
MSAAAMDVEITLSTPDTRAVLRAARGLPAPSALLTLVLDAPAVKQFCLLNFVL